MRSEIIRLGYNQASQSGGNKTTITVCPLFSLMHKQNPVHMIYLYNLGQPNTRYYCVHSLCLLFTLE